MKRSIGIIALISFVLLPAFSPSWAETLTVLHTNDTHSTLTPYGPSDTYGGIARMATLVGRLKAKDENVLVLNAGDVFVGTFEFNKYLGYPELKIMESLYDAMCLGNHEFDLGIDVLTGVISGSIAQSSPIAMPFLCANINLKDHPGLRQFVQPRLIKDVGGIKVGIVGVTTTGAQYYSSDVAALWRNPYRAAGAQAAALRSQGCEVVVCISHLGLAADTLGLSQVPGIDIIVGGHSHDALKQPIVTNGKVIVQAGEYGKYLGELAVDYDGQAVSLQNYKLHQITPDIPEEPTTAQTVTALKRGIQDDARFGMVFTERVATAAWDLNAKWTAGSPYRDTPVGNLIADAMKSSVENAGFVADCSLQAMGYIGHKVYKGKVVGEDIMRSVPYGYDPTSGLGFKIYVVQLVGLQILAGLEFSVRYVEYDDSFSMQSSGLTFAYDSSKPPAPLGSVSRIDPTSVMIDGYPMYPMGLYRVALPEKLLDFLESMGLEPYSKVDTGVFVYDAVRDHMKTLGSLRYRSEGRIIDRAFLVGGPQGR
ncbi:MAG: 5'-nucleotidase C-terminal domain-containing protein [Acidobacteriota bacterium]